MNTGYKALLIFLLYLFLIPYLNPQLDKYWVSTIVAAFKPGIAFNILLVLLFAFVTYRGRYIKMKAADYVLLLVYLQWRCFDSYWTFWPISFHTIHDCKIVFRYIDLIAVFYVVKLGATIYRAQQARKKIVYEQGLFYPDLALGDLAKMTGSTPEQLDKEGLNRYQFVRQLVQVIVKIKPFKAFVIGINGEWGAGKTSLMTMVRDELRRQSSSKRHSIIEFSPWLFNDTESLIRHFFKTLEAEFPLNQSLTADLAAYSKQLASLEKTMLKTELIESLLAGAPKIKQRYEDIISQLALEGRTLFIFIDNLDRLDKKEVVETLRLVRLLADFPNTIYLIGYDREYINAAISSELTSYRPEKYADKIFNIEFKIPALTQDLIRERLSKNLREQFRLLQEDIEPIAETELTEALARRELDRIVRTERDIKQFANNLVIRYMSIKEEVNFYFFFLLELIYYRNIYFFNAIYRNRSSILEWYQELERDKASGDDEASDKIEMRFKKLIGPVADNESMSLFRALFYIGVDRKRLPLSNSRNFARYFSLTLLADDFTQKEFDEAFSKETLQIGEKLIELNAINSPLLRDKLNDKIVVPTHDDRQSQNWLTGLLRLYNDIYHRKTISGRSGGLDINHLEILLNNFMQKNNVPIDTLKKCVLQESEKDYIAFSYLMRVDAKFITGIMNNGTKQLQNYKTFRQTQIVFLERELITSQPINAERLLAQLGRLASFVHFFGQNAPRTEANQWFLDNVLIAHKTAFQQHATIIVAFIKQEALKAKSLHELLDNYFAGLLSNQALTAMPAFEDYRDLYSYVCFDKKQRFTFSKMHAVHLSNTLFNAPYPDIIPISDSLLIEIELEPMQAESWKWEFCLSRTKELDPLEARTDRQYPTINIIKNQQELTLTVGQAAIWLANIKELLNNKYKNTGITIVLDADDRGNIYIHIKDNHNNMSSPKKLSGFDEFRFLQMSVWSEDVNFIIESRVKIGRRLIEYQHIN